MSQYKVKQDVIVTAHVITAVEKSAGGVISITLDNDEHFALTNTQVARYKPVEGDYYVTTADGYEYLNPKSVFEKKYEKIDG